MKTFNRLSLVHLVNAVLFSALAFAQPVTMNTPAPPAPSVSVGPVGTPGFTPYYYIVIANYPAGTAASQIIPALNGNATLNGTNYNQVGWQLVAGALTYDVLRLTSPTYTGTCTCSVATGLSATTSVYADQGGSLSSYTQASGAQGVQTQVYVNNRDYAFPKMRVQLVTNGTIADHLAEVPSGTGVPTYCIPGDVWNQINGALLVCGTANTFTPDAQLGGKSETETPVAITGTAFVAVGAPTTLAAGRLNVVGRTLEVDAYGVYTNAAASLLNAQIALCSVSGCATGTVFAPAGCSVTTTNQANNLTNGQWHIHCVEIVHAIGATATLNAKSTVCANLGAATSAAISCFDDTSTAVSATVDLTAAWFITPMFKFTTSNAGNTATAQTFTAKFLN